MVQSAGALNWKSVLEVALTSLAYLLFGAMAATIGTFAHRTRFFVGEFPVWIGCIGAVAAVLLIAVGLRWYLDEWTPSLMFFLGVVLTVFLYSTPGPGRSVLFPAGELTGPALWWLYGAALVAGLPLLVPKIRQRNMDARRSSVRAGTVETASVNEKESAS
ncbi:hypothetical protein [uncultured Gulosibacter sp.]|uniref:hypothetical protein n=1 Tax=uncultured Gulosibacter sp. TaxID=1339167 RepID=UPI00288B5CED|nr:hypothetical protein [uncultured Gulosibacter sp.]